VSDAGRQAGRGTVEVWARLPFREVLQEEMICSILPCKDRACFGRTTGALGHNLEKKRINAGPHPANSVPGRPGLHGTGVDNGCTCSAGIWHGC